MDVVSEWPGRIAEIHVGVGERVTLEQELVTIESMKMLMPVTSPRAGAVTAIAVAVDQYVDSGALLVTLD